MLTHADLLSCNLDPSIIGIYSNKQGVPFLLNDNLKVLDIGLPVPECLGVPCVGPCQDG